MYFSIRRFNQTPISSLVGVDKLVLSFCVQGVLLICTLHALFLLLCARVIKSVYMKSVPIISGPQEYNKINLDGF